MNDHEQLRVIGSCLDQIRGSIAILDNYVTVAKAKIAELRAERDALAKQVRAMAAHLDDCHAHRFALARERDAAIARAEAAEAKLKLAETCIEAVERDIYDPIDIDEALKTYKKG